MEEAARCWEEAARSAWPCMNGTTLARVFGKCSRRLSHTWQVGRGATPIAPHLAQST